MLEITIRRFGEMEQTLRQSTDIDKVLGINLNLKKNLFFKLISRLKRERIKVM